MEGGGVRRQACARCKIQRKKCNPDCTFAQYFPADQRQSFANVHKVFGADNFIKIIQEVSDGKQREAVRSMVYEAGARIRDPFYGCFGEILALQRQLADKTAEAVDKTAEVERLKVLLAGGGPVNSN